MKKGGKATGKMADYALQSDERKAEYDARGWKYDDTIKGYDKDGNKIKDDKIEPDFVSALKLCKRRRIGPLRPESNRELFYKK